MERATYIGVFSRRRGRMSKAGKYILCLQPSSMLGCHEWVLCPASACALADGNSESGEEQSMLPCRIGGLFSELLT